MVHLEKVVLLEKMDPNWTMLLICDLLNSESKVALMKVTEPLQPISDRPNNLSNKLIDLSKHYNVSPDAGWPGVVVENASNPLAEIEPLHESHGIQFDYRGVIQLHGAHPQQRHVEYPLSSSPIRVGQTCEQIHLLHAAAQNADITGNTAGRLEIYYTDGSSESLEFIVGYNSIDWFKDSPQEAPTDQNTRFTFETDDFVDWYCKVLHTSWYNPHPYREIEHLILSSANGEAAPFFLAITIE